MELEVISAGVEELDADVIAIAISAAEELPEALAGAPGAADAKGIFRRVAVLHPGSPERVLAIGVGERDQLDPERLRVVAALAAKRAASLEARALAWVLPGLADRELEAATLVEGTVLASYRFDRFKSADADDPLPPRLDRLVLACPEDDADAVTAAAATAMVTARAANRARDLQNLPANELTPSALAARAEEIAATDERVEAEILDRAAIASKGMGGLTAVAQGSATEPRLIVLRYRGGGDGSAIGLVGKGVTFDSGGISIKPAAAMHEMKMDMSGAAAVLESLAAIAELELSIELVAVVPATENMPSGSSIKPGDVITQLNGKTVEVNNTDAEGRLTLADALTYCVRDLGADRVVDIATLTGAVVIALGSTYAALISNDDDWAAAVERAANESGELAWRLPLHAEYKQLTKGAVADLTNAAAKREAGTIYAGSFLEEFVDEVPWAHLDIAGTAWDTGREYAGEGATGFGVRLLVRLARDIVAAA